MPESAESRFDIANLQGDNNRQCNNNALSSQCRNQIGQENQQGNNRANDIKFD